VLAEVWLRRLLLVVWLIGLYLVYAVIPGEYSLLAFLVFSVGVLAVYMLLYRRQVRKIRRMGGVQKPEEEQAPQSEAAK